MKIWIFNHYATDMYFDGAGRHQSLAKYLIRKGHDVTIFCANTLHNSDIIVNTGNEKFIKKIGEDEVPYIFVKTSKYEGNGISRIRNMTGFYFGIKAVFKELLKKEVTPDVILASSVHPLTLIAGIQLGKRYNVPCICEVRDLWPETLISLNKLKGNSLIAKVLYKGEKWIYKNAAALIFTMEGGRQYIIDQNWENEIDLDKVYYLNNGIDSEIYDANKKYYKTKDIDLENDKIKVIYTGSIRKANGIERIIDVAQLIDNDSIRFLIYGDGDEKKILEEEVKKRGLNNIHFKGAVEKKYIPYILSRADILLVNYAKEISNNENDVSRYGGSHNKLFEYLAAGKPIVYSNPVNYNLVDKYGCGIVLEKDTGSKEYAKAIMDLISADEDTKSMYFENCKVAIKNFDFRYTVDLLEKICMKVV